MLGERSPLAEGVRVRRPTLHAVAARAGVSKSSVSRVINGEPTVAPEIRQIVMAAVTELGYVPNGAARNLVTQKTNTIAIIVSDPAGRSGLRRPDVRDGRPRRQPRARGRRQAGLARARGIRRESSPRRAVPGRRARRRRDAGLDGRRRPTARRTGADRVADRVARPAGYAGADAVGRQRQPRRRDQGRAAPARPGPAADRDHLRAAGHDCRAGSPDGVPANAARTPGDGRSLPSATSPGSPAPRRCGSCWTTIRSSTPCSRPTI